PVALCLPCPAVQGVRLDRQQTVLRRPDDDDEQGEEEGGSRERVLKVDEAIRRDMAEGGFDPCECVCSHEYAMRRLINLYPGPVDQWQMEEI
ncbi:hypothetical protein CRUP_001198, partial [Coryphaenoides rupestris]